VPQLLSPEPNKTTRAVIFKRSRTASAKESSTIST
jgi:hypothetical protein